MSNVTSPNLHLKISWVDSAHLQFFMKYANLSILLWKAAKHAIVTNSINVAEEVIFKRPRSCSVAVATAQCSRCRRTKEYWPSSVARLLSCQSWRDTLRTLYKYSPRAFETIEHMTSLHNRTCLFAAASSCPHKAALTSSLLPRAYQAVSCLLKGTSLWPGYPTASYYLFHDANLLTQTIRLPPYSQTLATGSSRVTSHKIYMFCLCWLEWRLRWQQGSWWLCRAQLLHLYFCHVNAKANQLKSLTKSQ